LDLISTILPAENEAKLCIDKVEEEKIEFNDLGTIE